uniref:Ig-like domain-containing protein n=1 Tax=Dromaius novaehollandiae TaxID=8790 RepID=A0A8C4JXN4_DRONO
ASTMAGALCCTGMGLSSPSPMPPEVSQVPTAAITCMEMIGLCWLAVTPWRSWWKVRDVSRPPQHLPSRGKHWGILASLSVKQGNGGRYSCQCYIKGTPPKWSSTSEYLELVCNKPALPHPIASSSYLCGTGKFWGGCLALYGLGPPTPRQCRHPSHPMAARGPHARAG